MIKLEFGKTYSVSSKMMRYAVWDYARGNLKGHEWRRVKLDRPARAMYIGYRTVYDGDIERHWQEQHTFKRTKTHKIALFVINERTNPIRVLLDDVSIED